ncbi:MAG: hypothetical protein ACRER5_06980 [Pseudomonas sp.]
MMLRLLAAVSMVALLSGCATRLDRAEIRTVSSPTTQRLACPLRLETVVDARPTQEAGILGHYAFRFANVTASITEALQVLGWSTAPEALPVTVSIQKLYLGAQNDTRMGVAAFSVQAEGKPAFVVRGQAAAMNWSASQASANGILTEAVGNARSELAGALNSTCAISAK